MENTYMVYVHKKGTAKNLWKPVADYIKSYDMVDARRKLPSVAKNYPGYDCKLRRIYGNSLFAGRYKSR